MWVGFFELCDGSSSSGVWAEPAACFRSEAEQTKLIYAGKSTDERRNICSTRDSAPDPEVSNLPGARYLHRG